MVAIYLNHDLADNDRRKSIFRGDILLYSRVAATQALADYALEMITEALAPHEPQQMQFHVPVEDFIKRIGPLKTRFTNDSHTKELVRKILESFGCDPQQTYFDVPRLRVVPHGGYLASGVSYAYQAHRDIWYASPTAQVNWWLPVFSVTAERAMSFFAEYWDRPLRNSSADFDYGEWCKVGRRLAISQINEDTRKHPLPLETGSCTSEFRIAGTKGDAILFSASQLHATAPNCSGSTRFSIDFRTVNLTDIRTGAGAPNIDGSASGTTLGDFISASNFATMNASEWTPKNAA